MKYLQFSSIADLLDHIEAENVAAIQFVGSEPLRTVHLDCTERHFNGSQGFKTVSIYAVVSQNCGDYLAVYGILIHQTDDIWIRGDDERSKDAKALFRAEIEQRLDKVREEITLRSFLVKDGVWTGEPPCYLRSAL